MLKNLFHAPSNFLSIKINKSYNCNVRQDFNLPALPHQDTFEPGFKKS
ncbi:MAG: hypothetical protein WD077_06420 [Bacteroidia bacterium]